MKELEKYRSALFDIVVNLDLMNRNIKKEKLNREEVYYTKLLKEFGEINQSLNRIYIMKKYLGWTPNTKFIMLKFDYLLYHIENYYNEIYILKNRLNSYLTLIVRLFRKDIKYKKIIEMANPIFEKSAISLKDMISIRGKHTHEFRFEDDEINKIDITNFMLQITEHHNSDVVAGMFKSDYIEIRNKWKNIIIENNKKIENVVDVYFKGLNSFILDDNNKLVIPNNYKISNT